MNRKFFMKRILSLLMIALTAFALLPAIALAVCDSTAGGQHDGPIKNVDAVAADCTTPGTTAGTRCVACGLTITGLTEVDATGHTSEPVPAIAPSYNAPGRTAGTKCSVCDLPISGMAAVPPLVLPRVYVQNSYANHSGGGHYPPGTRVTIYAGKRENFAFQGWTVVSGGVSLSDKNGSYASFVMPASDVVIKASWRRVVFDLPVDGVQNGFPGTGRVGNRAAAIKANDDKLDALLNDANTTGNIQMVARLKRDIDAVKIPAAVLSKLANAANADGSRITGLTIVFDKGSVELDSAALQALSDQAMGGVVTIGVEKATSSAINALQRAAAASARPHDLVMELFIWVDGKTPIRDLKGGKAVVTMPYSPASGSNAAARRAWLLAQDGSLVPLTFQYNGANETVSVESDQAGAFAIGYGK